MSPCRWVSRSSDFDPRWLLLLYTSCFGAPVNLSLVGIQHQNDVPGNEFVFKIYTVQGALQRVTAMLVASLSSTLACFQVSLFQVHGGRNRGGSDLQWAPIILKRGPPLHVFEQTK